MNKLLQRDNRPLLVVERSCIDPSAAPRIPISREDRKGEREEGPRDEKALFHDKDLYTR